MIVTISIVAYLVLPFILFGINDYYAGVWYDRFHTNMSVYYACDGPIVVLGHILWPFFILVLTIAWVYQFINYKLEFDFDTIHEAGRAKRKQDQDLDYQADKYLLGQKDNDNVL